ncbi:MAG: SDR family NAD(P)-dependent oxidoreductase [Alistipes sp.]|nr:SDR family NAD(P)-dependent oxidoreductase [Alistipes sp.]
MTKIKGRTLLITGGASGIGRIMGRMALQRGAKKVVVWDINEDNIAATESELKSYGEVKGYKVDVANTEMVKQLFALTTKECGDVDILINSAGIITGNKTFAEQSQQDIDRTMAINATAPMTVALQALPPMLERNVGHICNIASAAGFIANPRMSTYAASKWAVIGWSDSLRVELQEAKSNVHVTTIAPYYISTGMFDGVRSRIIPLLKPEWVAKKILNAIEKNKKISSWPLGYHLIRTLQALLPLRVLDLLCKVLGIYNALDHFKGRK